MLLLLMLQAALVPAVVIEQGSSVLRDALDGVLPALLFTVVAMAVGWSPAGGNG